MSFNVISAAFGVIGGIFSLMGAIRHKEHLNTFIRLFTLVAAVVGLMTALNAQKAKTALR